MGKVALKKVRFTGLKKNYKLLMEQLHRSWAVQVIKNESLVEASSVEGDAHFGVYDLARVSFAINFLARYRTESSKLDSFMSGGKLVLSEADAKGRLALFEKDSERVLKRCETLEEDMVRTRNVIDKTQLFYDKLLPYRDLEVVVGQQYESESVQVALYQGPTKGLKSFMRGVSAVSNLVHIEVLQESKNISIVRVIVAIDTAGDVKNIIEENGFMAFDWGVDLSAYTGKSPSDILEAVAADVEALKEQAVGFVAEAEELAHFLDDLKILHDFNEWRTLKNDIQSDMYTSDRLFVFDGWLPVSDYNALQKWVNNTFVGEVSLDEMPLQEGESEPVQFDNGFLVSPFEVFTNMYGAPSAKDVDPTPAMAPFFFVFFGLCFSDVGYGFLLLLVASFFLLFGKFALEVKRGFRLLLFCGITTIVGGVITGGYFGLTPEQLPVFMLTTNMVPNTVDTPMLVGQLFSPLSQPMVFLKLSLLLGGMHLVMGVFLDGVKSWRAAEKRKAVLESAPWILLLSALVPLGLAFLDPEFLTVGQSGLLKTLALVGAGWLFFGHMLIDLLAGKNILKVVFISPIMGAMKLYGITAYLTDLLSYSRIMALGLATGVIGYAMNLSAITLGESIPVVGIAVAVGFVIFGHALNFGLSILAAFIHTGRLQFVEFFSKFYDGTGSRFAPFKRASRYLFFR